LAFDLQISDREQAYYDHLPISPGAKAIIDQFVGRSIGDVSDEYRLDPENRPAPGSPYFVVQRIFLDRWPGGDGRIHRIDFYVSDAKAAFGVLLIAYIELH
jgi:hypothetical protein